MSEGSLKPPDQSRPDRRGAFFLLFFCLMAIGAGNTMLIAAVLPPLSREVGLPDWMAGAVFALSAFFWSAFSPFWGKQSNRHGRRPVAALGLAGYSVSMFLLYLSGLAAVNGWLTSSLAIFACLAISRSFFGVFGSGTNPAAQAYVADRTSQKERRSEIAFISSGFSVGTVVGPAFAAALVATLGILSPLLLTAIIAAIMAALIWFRLPEQRDPITDATQFDSETGARGLWHSSKVLPFLIYAVCMSLATGILTQVFVFSVMDKLNVAGPQAAQFTGPAFTVGAMAVLLAQLVLIPRMKMKNKTLMWVGCIPLLLGALLLIVAQDFATLVTAQFLIGLGQGLARPGFSSGASLAVSPQLQGNVAGLVISANGAGYIVTPLFGLFVYEYIGRDIPFLIAAGLLAFMAIYAYVALRDGVGEFDPDEELPEEFD
ncbi:MAG: MFS transporter [Hyphomonas sp.]|nr:MFS transporter [Hyphomonas sp.]